MSKQRPDMNFVIGNFMQVAQRGVKPVNSRVYGANVAAGLAGLERTANLAGHMAKAYFSDLDKIDTEIAPEYRVAKRNESARQTFANLQKFEEDEIVPLQKRIDGLRGRAMADLNSRRAVKAGTDTEAGRLRLELRQQAFLNQLRDLTALQVEGLYQAGDEFTRTAIESAAPRVIAPKGGIARCEPFISSDLVEETRKKQALAEAPALAEEISELESIVMTLNQVAKAALNGVQESVKHLSFVAPEPKTPTPATIEIR